MLKSAVYLHYNNLKKKKTMNLQRIEKLKKRIKALDNVLDNEKNKISGVYETILWQLRKEIQKELNLQINQY